MKRNKDMPNTIPTLIGIANRSFPGCSLLRTCDGCRNPFLGRKLQMYSERCKVCSVDGPAQRTKNWLKQAMRAARRKANNERAARLNPAWEKMKKQKS